jgi:hypothetical protein
LVARRWLVSGAKARYFKSDYCRSAEPRRHTISTIHPEAVASSNEIPFWNEVHFD